MISNRAEYFPHDYNAAGDPKIMLMMAQLGLEAYGIYWILVEYLRQQPGYSAPLNLLDPLSRRYGSSKEKFETVITKFQLFEYNDSTFWSPSLIRRMEPLEKKRQVNKENALRRWSKDATVLPSHSDGNAEESRVEESRVEKSRVKKSRVKKSITPPAILLNQNELLVKKWNEWCEFRKLLKKPYKTVPGAAAAYNKLLNLSDSNSEIAIAIINQSMENEWLGFFPLKVSSRAALPGEDPIQKELREVKAAREARLKREAQDRDKMLEDIEMETMLDNLKDGDKG